jgi:hypothetical protein
MEYKGRRFLSDAIGTLDSDGIWKVIQTIKEFRSADGITWEVIELSAMGLDTVLDAAYNTAWKSLSAQFKDGLDNGSGDSLFKE